MAQTAKKRTTVNRTRRARGVIGGKNLQTAMRPTLEKWPDTAVLG
jgi:hypothetical protein